MDNAEISLTPEQQKKLLHTDLIVQEIFQLAKRITALSAQAHKENIRARFRYERERCEYARLHKILFADLSRALPPAAGAAEPAGPALPVCCDELRDCVETINNRIASILCTDFGGFETHIDISRDYPQQLFIGITQQHMDRAPYRQWLASRAPALPPGPDKADLESEWRSRTAAYESLFHQ